MEHIYNFIDGETAESQRWIDVYEPATGEIYARAPESDNADVEQAVAAASRAAPNGAIPRPRNGPVR